MIELFYPIKPYSVNQAFGENKNPTYNQKGLKGHSGIDLYAVHGQKIYAAHDGTCYPTVDDHGGNGIILQADPEFNNYFTLYWHLIDDDAVVHTGQKVKAGDLLAYADNTGTSTGDHLHFGFSIYAGIDYQNGYEGHIDPQPYFNGKYAEDINNPPPKPVFKFTKTLKVGSWNNEVKQLQTILASHKLYSGVVDGVFGKMTQSSVIAFQSQHGLVSDGIVGMKTRAIINTLL